MGSDRRGKWSGWKGKPWVSCVPSCSFRWITTSRNKGKHLKLVNVVFGMWIITTCYVLEYHLRWLDELFHSGTVLIPADNIISHLALLMSFQYCCRTSNDLTVKFGAVSCKIPLSRVSGHFFLYLLTQFTHLSTLSFKTADIGVNGTTKQSIQRNLGRWNKTAQVYYYSWSTINHQWSIINHKSITDD